MSLRVSQIFPFNPISSIGIRTAKLPFFTSINTFSNCWLLKLEVPFSAFFNEKALFVPLSFPLLVFFKTGAVYFTDFVLAPFDPRVVVVEILDSGLLMLFYL